MFANTDLTQAVKELLNNVEGRDLETVKNDTLTVKEKIEVAVIELGSTKEEEVINWINNNLFRKVSERHIRRVMQEMCDDGTLVKVGDVVFLVTTCFVVTGVTLNYIVTVIVSTKLVGCYKQVGLTIYKLLIFADTDCF